MCNEWDEGSYGGFFEEVMVSLWFEGWVRFS